MAKTFSVYRSSAGSGKTRTLAKEYLKLALGFKSDYYRYILAVTFTNKASQEMKDRILDYLNAFANGESNELANELKTELKLDDHTFQEHSKATQAAILHGYAQFSISTIDAFFQKVIRSFTREAGLVGDYRLEVEQDAVLESVIDNLIDELGTNADLTDWVVDFARENLENERAWDVRFSLIEFAKEIFREEFKEVESVVNESTAHPTYFADLKATLLKVKSEFLLKVSAPARNALSTIQSNGWAPEDFSYGKNSGLFTFFRTFAYEKTITKIKAPGDRIKTYFTIPENWPSKKSPHNKSIYKAAVETLTPALSSILEELETSFRKALSAELALKNMYVFGLIADISRKLKEYKDENNLMLLADAPKFLNGVIQESDTPFIYEKIGSFYRNYLIDEFQDTSGMQWKNFQPLITNSLDQGYTSLVVGDVKQAIYRWRGGDLSLLQQEIANVVGKDRVNIKELDSNFRSAAEVVDFNNDFFSTAASIIAAETRQPLASDAYLDVRQKTTGKTGGLVQVQFIEEPKVQQDLGEESAVPLEQPTTWRMIALEKIPIILEALQQKNVPLKDIAILVRKNDEGQQIVTYLLQHKASAKAKPGCRYDVVSNESLRIDGAASVNLLLGAMRYLLNPEDAIARAQLGFEYARIHERKRSLHDVFSVTNQSIFENNLPERFSKEKPALKKLALIELTETLIEIFEIGGIQGELIYLQAFQDLVLEFYSRERNDLGAFLEWWEDNKHKKSIQISGDVDAAQILTIHKSKGLQFKFVLIPFCAWGLDHDNWQAPNLWVQSNEIPFNDAGYLPIKYSKILEESVFAEYYQVEKTKTYVDNLNLLYVALTRVEQAMFVMAPAPEVKGNKDTVANLLYKSISTNETLKSKLDEGALEFKTGSIESKHDSIIAPNNGISLNQYHANTWRQKLVIKQSADNFFNKKNATIKTRTHYGIQMHAVLSRLNTISELETMLDRITLEGLIAQDDRQSVANELKTLLAIPQIALWFDPQWKVKTEIPVILPGGEENRIDRLLIKDRRAIVIDFKTGERRKADEQQVLEYMEIVRRMNFAPVEGFLLYLKEKEVVEVKPAARARVVKKVADKDQLTLGW